MSTSLLSPLVVGSHIDSGQPPTMGNALLAASRAIPSTYETSVFRPAGWFQSWTNDGHRTYLTHSALGDEAAPYEITVTFSVRPGPKARQEGVGPVDFWRLGLRTFATDPFGVFGPDIAIVGLLELAYLQIDRDGFEGAFELGLVRDLWLSTLRSTDPQLVVHGGDAGWTSDWATHLVEPAPSTTKENPS